MTAMNLFVSGPLMFGELIRAVAGRAPRRQDAALRGYAQFLVPGEGEAAMIPFPDREVDGVVYRDVDEAELKRVDAFQGRRFERVAVTVEAGGGEWIEADAYVLKPRRRKALSAEAWDEVEYRQKRLTAVLKGLRS
jgi:hypothetical protein